MTHALCPHCGYNLQAEQRMVSRRVAYLGYVLVDGVPLGRGNVNGLIGALMHAWPRRVSTDALVARVCGEDVAPETLRNLVRITRLRLQDLGLPNLILTVDRGYLWGQEVRLLGTTEMAGRAERDAQILELRQHLSVGEIARELRVSRDVVYKTLRRAGLSTRLAATERDEAIAALYQKHPAKHVADVFGIHEEHVRRIAIGLGRPKQPNHWKRAPGASPAGERHEHRQTSSSTGGHGPSEGSDGSSRRSTGTDR